MNLRGYSGKLFLSLLLFTFGLVNTAALAQNEACSRPSGAVEIRSPAVTAEDVEKRGGDLQKFILEARDRAESLKATIDVGYFGCLVREEGSEWRSGKTYIVLLTGLDGRVNFHAKDMSLSGRRLDPDIFKQIVDATGGYDLNAGEFHDPDGGAVLGGHAVGYFSPVGTGRHFPFILLVGVELQESHLAQETADNVGRPEVGAEKVVDRETLKAFVNGAISHFIELSSKNRGEAMALARSVFRRSPWKHGNIYLFIYDPKGLTHLHGAFPDKFEFRRPSIARDPDTGEIVTELISRAVESDEDDDGVFVEYRFDDPIDDSKEFVSKVAFVRELAFTNPLTGARESLIFGSGFYP